MTNRPRLSLLLLSLLVATGVMADDRHQSYISYQSGELRVVQAYDGREIDGQVNLPIFPGDDLRVVRGRAEIRLADGNTVGVDDDSYLRLQSIYGAYEGDGEQTVIELVDGEAMVYRDSADGLALRLDTRNASYVTADDGTIYGVSTDRSRDAVAVFGGVLEVRTRNGQTRLRAGERATLDENGVYDVHGLARGGMTDFQRWFIRRSDRYRDVSSRYLGGQISYASYDLDAYGSWVYVHDYSDWVWRPRVSVGWRPYYHGRWSHGIGGSLVWVSDEPWGWVPYHYGRWAYSPAYGWVWVPGYRYSPAWVYWVYGPSYIGWIPAGWYDCYTPYRQWYHRPRVEIGVGFHGRIRLGGSDLNGWTFVNPDRIVSTRVDRAALTTDAIRERLRRDGDGATLSSVPARLTRDDLRDPASAVRRIARGGAGGGTGKESEGSSLGDVTDFFRRDPDLSTSTRQRIERAVAPEGAGSSGRVTRSPAAPVPSTGSSEPAGSRIDRSRPETPSSARTEPGTATRVTRPAPSDSPAVSRPKPSDSPAPRTPARIDRGDSAREIKPDRTIEVTAPRTPPPARSTPVPARVRAPAPVTRDNAPSTERKSDQSDRRSAPVPRRVIDSIAGGKVVPVPREESDRGSADATDRSPRSPSPSVRDERSSPPVRRPVTSSPSRTDDVPRADRSSSDRPGVRAPSSSRSSGSSSVSRPTSSGDASSSSSSRVRSAPSRSSSSSTSSKPSSSSSSRSSGRVSRSSKGKDQE